MNWNTFLTRTLSAIVYALIMIVGLWYSDPMAIFILAFIILFFTSRELYSIIDRLVAGQTHHWIQWCIGIICSSMLIVALLDKQFFTILPFIAIPALILSSMVLVSHKRRLGQLSIIACMLYLGIPLACLIELRGMDRWLPLGIIILVWVNDTMAYIIGSFIGKTPLSEISPKKTWEGTIGGIILTIVISIILGKYVVGRYDTYLWATLGAVVAVFGNLGDLLESLLKRKAGVKDSGNIMPGHGGALDRFDSILAVFPFALLVVYFFM